MSILSHLVQATIGVDFGSKNIVVAGQAVTAQIWDTGVPAPAARVLC